jgi:hypothetical protein
MNVQHNDCSTASVGDVAGKRESLREKRIFVKNSNLHKAVTAVVVLDHEMLKTRRLNQQVAQVNVLDNATCSDVDAYELRGATAHRCLESVDDASIEDPENVVWVEEDVDCRLKSLAIAFLLETPAWVGCDGGGTLTSLHGDLTEGERNACLEPRNSDKCLVSVDLCSCHDHIARNVSAGLDVNVLSRSTWPFELRSTKLKRQVL